MRWHQLSSWVQIKKLHIHLQLNVITRYYPKHLYFAFSDILLGFASLFFNPYRICRKQSNVYGETPLQSLERIAQFCNLKASDTWMELGSGRGRSCFWIAHWVGCRTIGIEKCYLFYAIAQTIRTLLRIKNLTFTHADWRDVDFTKASFVYLYSTCMSFEELLDLSKIMEFLPSHAQILTISQELPEQSSFRVIGSFPITFPWGEATGYLHKKHIV